MNTEQVLRAGILDLIFEGRNKLYGAYPIRKNYQKRLAISLGLIIIFAILAFYLISRATPGLYVLPVRIIEDPVYAPTPIPDLPQNPTRQQPLNSTKKSGTLQSRITKVVPVGNRIQFSDDTVKLVLNPPKIHAVDVQPGNFYAINNSPGSGQAGMNTPVPGLNSMDGISSGPVENPDVMPEFPGGEAALIRYLQKNLQMPDVPEHNGKPVKIMAHFVINMEGKLTALTTDGSGDGYDKEVRRVLRKMPAWIPGKTKGRPVSCYYNLPVIFRYNSF